MAFPEHQIAPTQAREIVYGQRGAECALLHVAVARADDAACCECNLHQSRTIESQAGLAAPQIGNADKTFRDGDEIRLAALDGGQVPGRDAKVGLDNGQFVEGL